MGFLGSVSGSKGSIGCMGFLTLWAIGLCGVCGLNGLSGLSGVPFRIPVVIISSLKHIKKLVCFDDMFFKVKICVFH